MTSSLQHDLSREVRRAETSRLLAEAATASATERAALIDQVILANVGVARSIASSYRNRGVPVEDLEQVGYLALIRAARKFDGTKAEDFLTYAVPTIRGEIKRYFRDLGWSVRPPRRIQELQGRVRATRDTLRTEDGQLPTPTQIAAHLDAPVADVVEALGAQGCFTPMSLDVPVAMGDGGLGESLGDLLPGVDLDLAAVETRALLADALAQLTERERRIVHYRFVDELTQAEIGARIGVTQMQVSRLLAAIMRKLRDLVAREDEAAAAA